MNEPEFIFFQQQMDKRTKSENLKYIDQKLLFVENLKNYTNIL
jgi:hypothetical protein